MAGMSVREFTGCKVAWERNFLLRIADECFARRRDEREELATMIVNKLGKAFKGGK